MKRIISAIAVMAMALVGVTACGGGGSHHATREGCKAAVLAAMRTDGTATEVPQCKGLSSEVRQSIAIEILSQQGG